MIRSFLPLTRFRQTRQRRLQGLPPSLLAVARVRYEFSHTQALLPKLYFAQKNQVTKLGRPDGREIWPNFLAEFLGQKIELGLGVGLD